MVEKKKFARHISYRYLVHWLQELPLVCSEKNEVLLDNPLPQLKCDLFWKSFVHLSRTNRNKK